jgi:hypothetical protein
MAANYEAGLDAFLAEAKLTYQRMFESQEQAELKTFSQREVRVYDEGRRLSCFLLEAHLARDNDSQPGTLETALCPHCQQPARRVGGKNLEIRPVTTLVGGVNFARAKYKCKRCRKVFFPPGSQVGIASVPAQSRSAQTCGGTGRQCDVL